MSSKRIILFIGLAFISHATPTRAQVPPSVGALYSQTVYAGSQVYFSTYASGTAPLCFQWQFNGLNLPSATSSADGSSQYILTNALRSDSGDYRVIVTNQFGSATSAVARLTVFIRPVESAWAASYNGPANSNDSPAAVAVDGGGNVYVTGYSFGTTSTSDFTTIKYDADGQQIWTRRYHGPGVTNNDSARALALDSFGNAHVTGPSYASDGLPDYATIKYDPDGNELWVARYNGPANGDDVPVGLGLDAAGNVYVTGTSRGTNFTSDYATVKYSPSGEQLWVARHVLYDGFVTAMAVSSSGDVYVTGSPNFTTIKYDTDGNRVWTANYDGTAPYNHYSNPMAIAVDRAGNVYVTGHSFGTGFAYEYATLKYDKNGTQMWVVRHASPLSGNAFPTALAVDENCNIYVTGYAFGFDRTADFVTIKYDSDGQQAWVARYNGPPYVWLYGQYYPHDFGSAIAVDPGGNVYVTGYSGGDRVYYTVTVKYGPGGNQVWETPNPNPLSPFLLADRAAPVGPGTNAPSMTLGRNGDVYVVSTSYHEQIPDLRSLDYTTVKYTQVPLVSGLPSISQRPEGQTVPPGTGVALSVVATGRAPLTFQWRLNGSVRVLPGETNSTLLMTNAQRGGDYSVIVTSAEGITSSPEARLQFVTGLNSAQRLPDGGFQFKLWGDVGRAYDIQSSSNLVDWILLKRVTLALGHVQFQDSAAAQAVQRFYRAIEQP